MNRTKLVCSLACGVIASYVIVDVVTADEPSAENAMTAAEVMMLAKSGPGDKPKKKDSPYPPFKDITKDMVSKEGLFTLWSYPSDAKNKDKEKLLCQIPKRFLGQDFMLSTSCSGGGFFTAFPIDERVVRWELLDRQLILI